MSDKALPNLLNADVCRMKEKFWDHKPLVVQANGLLAVDGSTSFFGAFEETASQCRKVRQNVISRYFEKWKAFLLLIFLDSNLGIFECHLQVVLEVDGDKAGVLLARVHDVSLFEHVDLSIRNYFFEVICQKFSTDVDTSYSCKNGENTRAGSGHKFSSLSLIRALAFMLEMGRVKAWVRPGLGRVAKAIKPISSLGG